MASLMKQQRAMGCTSQRAAKAQARPVVRRTARLNVRAAAQVDANDLNEGLGFQKMRDGIKVAAEESVLTPRFYTTDFDEMEKLFSLELNPGLDMTELEACLQEFRHDYNQRHFVRNETFPPAAKNIKGATRKIFIEFLERSCTAEFSGFLLYKELARRLKTSNPPLAEIFLLLSRDEARHAGFINKALSDFNLALDLGFLTKNRKYTFFKPKFIIYTTFLSEKIGYWRYICVYRHLQRNPDCQLYPLFEYFENWCQDENRHGDFLAAALKCHPTLLKGWEAEFWSRFFCLSVYVTMYLNDHQRTKFYEALGMNTRQFNQHVIIETNNSSKRIFPVVPDVEHPQFFEKMNKLVEVNEQLIGIDRNQAIPGALKGLVKLPLYERLTALLLQIFFMPAVRAGSVDVMEPEEKAAVVY